MPVSKAMTWVRLAAAFVPATVTPVASSAVTLTLHPHAEVDSPVVSIGQLADLRSDVSGDASRAEALSELSIQLHLAPGMTARVTRQDLDAVITPRLNRSERPIRWTGSAQTVVRLMGHPVDSVRLLADARMALETWLRSITQDFKLTEIDTTNAIDARGLQTVGDESLSIRSLSGSVQPRIPVWVDVAGPNGVARRSFPIWFGVSASATIAVASHDIAAGAHLAPSDVGTAVVDLALLGSRRPLAEANDPRAVATRPIRTGEPLTRDLFRQARLVETGDEVRLRVSNGPIAIETIGVALEAGDNGQRVRVRNRRSGEVLIANVAAQDLVEVVP